MPNTKDGAKVIGAAIIDVEGYEGPKEIRAINDADTDALGRGARVHHAESPKTRTLSQTQGPRTAKGGRGASIRGPRNESIHPHINDAEVKIFEEILRELPENAKGTKLVRDLQPMLNDDESMVREVAAHLLSRLKTER